MSNILTVEKRLGKGKNSRCFLVKSGSKNYCLKVCSVKDKSNKKEIQNEINILLLLKEHQNIISLEEHFLKTGKEKKYFGLVFELMQMNLHDFMKLSKNGCIDEMNCKVIFKQIMSAINFCHFKLITHQDLKLENICINPDTLEIKIIDFGYATISKNEKEILSIKTCKGTPFYSSPEKFKRKKMDGRKSDIWSLGKKKKKKIILFFKKKKKKKNRGFAFQVGLWSIPFWKCLHQLE